MLFQVSAALRICDGFRVKNADTTGCGDGFYAALLHGLVRSGKSIAELTLGDLVWNCRIANAVGALTAAQHGAIPALPDAAVVEKILEVAESPSPMKNFLKIVLLSLFCTVCRLGTGAIFAREFQTSRTSHRKNRIDTATR